MVFYIKIEDLRKKVCLVVRRHVTQISEVISYSSIGTWKTVFIVLMMMLDDLEVKAADVLNEKMWTVLGPEFGDDAGKCAFIVRALYVWIAHMHFQSTSCIVYAQGSVRVLKDMPWAVVKTWDQIT